MNIRTTLDINPQAITHAKLEITENVSDPIVHPPQKSKKRSQCVLWKLWAEKNAPIC